MYRGIKFHGDAHKELELENGQLHVYANDEVFYALENKVYDMADNNLLIPRNVHMSYTPDAHVGVGTCIGTTAVWNMNDGFVSPSIVGSDIGCGMRVHKTSLHKDALMDKDLRRRLIDVIEEFVPVSDRFTKKYDDVDLEDVVTLGLAGLQQKYSLFAGKVHVEHASFPTNRHALSAVPSKSWGSAQAQLGTLGGGNHFIEIQYLVINEENRATAEAWGLFDGQVVIMIHSGSRGWGAAINKLITPMFKDSMKMWGVANPDPNLQYAPIQSDIGTFYLDLMHSALNYAVVNRHLIAYGVEQAFKKVFGETEVHMAVMYDLMHNYALKEFHRGSPKLVHRKGATRALPAGHFMNVPAYKETGHPALIPGSMGTSSYIMVGSPEGEKNFFSICHGAGRLRSRRATKELITLDEFALSMKVGEADEVMVNHRTLETILDECPQAYKDVDQIIDSVVKAKLATVVAQCKPLAAIKGV